METQVKISALSFALTGNGSAPQEAHILPAHDFKPDDGRKMDVPFWKMSAEIASDLIAKLSAKKNDTLIDYEHQSLFAALNGAKVPAAGWFKSMEYRPESGLWAVGIDWTPAALSHIKSKEYKYLSAVFTYNADGVVTEIISVALTNTPALDGLAALQALSINFNQGDKSMSGKDVVALTAELQVASDKVTALTTELKTANDKVTALAADLGKANEKVAALENEKVEAAKAAEVKQKADLITAALSDGRLIPAQKPWAETQSLAALTAFLDVTPKDSTSRQHKEGDDKGEHGLTKDELAMCSRMQIKPEDFAKTKAAK